MSRVLSLGRIAALSIGTLGALGVPQTGSQQAAKAGHAGFGSHFQTSDRCIACHNGLTTPNGEDYSIGYDWRPSMMANAGRDPYWQAGVRRESIEHPSAAKAIEDECSICHMPMARYESKLAGQEGEVFAHLPFNPKKLADRLAADGVSCSVCHQITSENLGKRESFVGGFRIDAAQPPGERRVYGPFEIDQGHTRIMRSSSRFQPTQGAQIRSAELCATCHTLYTKALGPAGQVIGELPEQMPYQEWLHSGYKDARTCQSCHMPVIVQDVPITAVLGEPRPGVVRHTFLGGNFFMQRLLNRFRNDLGVAALPQELEAAATRTVTHLQSEAAHIAINRIDLRGGRLLAEISVENQGGHKLPTAYPSRRVWLHVTVRDRNGRSVFESGALTPQGAIFGNDNDADASRFEPHYTEITSPDQVQIYEAIMVGPDGVPTTGLLTAVRYVKDNRLLPRGFDKKTADKDIAVQGGAADDEDFTAGGDTVRYSIAVGDAPGPFQIEAELWYQSISYRWAVNLKRIDAFETQRFVGYYESMASRSGVMLVRATAAK
jgi:hypothetical protein